MLRSRLPQAPRASCRAARPSRIWRIAVLWRERRELDQDEEITVFAFDDAGRDRADVFSHLKANRDTLFLLFHGDAAEGRLEMLGLERETIGAERDPRPFEKELKAAFDSPNGRLHADRGLDEDTASAAIEHLKAGKGDVAPLSGANGPGGKTVATRADSFVLSAFGVRDRRGNERRKDRQ